VFLKLGAGAFPVETHDSGAHAGLRRAAIEPAILDLVCPRPPRPRPAAQPPAAVAPRALAAGSPGPSRRGRPRAAPPAETR
jgi:hypothetical protein